MSFFDQFINRMTECDRREKNLFEKDQRIGWWTHVENEKTDRENTGNKSLVKNESAVFVSLGCFSVDPNGYTCKL